MRRPTWLIRGTFANRVPGEPLFFKDLDCHCHDPNKEFVLNPRPGPTRRPAPLGTFGTSAAYYNDYRTQRRPSEQFGMARHLRIRESSGLVEGASGTSRYRALAEKPNSVARAYHLGERLHFDRMSSIKPNA